MNKLTNILKASDSTLARYLSSKTDITDHKNYWFVGSENSSREVVFVSHIDTVRTSDNVVLKKRKGVLSNKNGVLGADDRAGVYACFQLLERLDCCVLFTNYEESGGIGVKTFIDENPDFDFSETKLFVELDRKGYEEFVTYNELPNEIADILIMDFCLTEAFGSYSDIADLSDHFCIPSINLAIGYYNQHTKDEYLVIDELENMIDIAQSIWIHSDTFPKLSIKKANIYKGYNSYWDNDNNSLYSNSFLLSDLIGEIDPSLDHEEIEEIEDIVMSDPVILDRIKTIIDEQTTGGKLWK